MGWPKEPMVECAAVRENFAGLGITLYCEREADHEGDHGSGPFVEFSSMWANELSSKRGQAT